MSSSSSRSSLSSGSGSCHVKTGPTYTPDGTIAVTPLANGRKQASFSMDATFDADPATGVRPGCCEVHQFIKWDQAFQTWRGGPPHAGFPATATFDTWYEDRDSNGKRYGHRTDAFSDPIAGCGDEYKTGANQDQLNGNHYCGKDSPGGPPAMTGTFQFQLKVIDICTGQEVGSGPVITVNW
jgi:hypothetical protein